jgi:hypothetical protein
MDVEGTVSALLLVLTASLLGLLPKLKPRALLTQSVIPALSGEPWLPTPASGVSGVALLSLPFSDDKQKSNSLITELGRPVRVVVRLSLLMDVCLLLTATAEAVMLPDATSAIAVTMATIANVVVLFAYIVIDIHTYLL